MKSDMESSNKALLERDERSFLPRVRIVATEPKLRDYTKVLIKSLTPRIPKSEFEGGIKLRCGTVISRPGYGKTEMIKNICKAVIAVYGEDKVNALTGRYLRPLILEFDAKPVQFLFVDDSTSVDKKSQKAMIKHYVRIRHDLKRMRAEREQEKSGVIIVIFSSHSFFMLDKQIRTLFNFIIMKSSDSNAFNRKTIINEFGYQAYKKLERITKKIGIDDDMSFLDDAVCAIIGMAQGGFIRFRYDPVEAAIIPWREVEHGIATVSSNILNKYNVDYTASEDWGNFLAILTKEVVDQYDAIAAACGFTSETNLVECLELWFNKFFLGKSNEALCKMSDLVDRSVNLYITRVNNYFRKFDTKQLQKVVSERWVLEGLAKIKPLSPVALCRLHRESNQPSDVCVHVGGERVLGINVKWFGDNRAVTNTVDATPECLSPPAALLVLCSSRRSDHPMASVRYGLLPEGECSSRIVDVPLVDSSLLRKGKKDNGFIMEAIGQQIVELIKPTKRSPARAVKKSATAKRAKKTSPKKRKVTKKESKK